MPFRMRPVSNLPEGLYFKPPGNWEIKILILRISIEPRHEKTGFLHMRKQRRRSASR